MGRIGVISKDAHLIKESDRAAKALGLTSVVLSPESLDPPDVPIASKDPPNSEQQTTEEVKPIVLIVYDATADPKLHISAPLNEVKKRYPTEKLIIVGDLPALNIAIQNHTLDRFDIADYIISPLDPTLFQQKLEYALSADALLTPQFLFQSKLKGAIDLGKQTQLTHLSEIGCSVLSPLPLKNGLTATLHSPLLGNNELSLVTVKVIENLPILENGAKETLKKYEIRLKFLGLKQEQLKAVRKQIDEEVDIPERPAPASTHPLPLRIALVSPSEDAIHEIRGALGDLADFQFTRFSGLKEMELRARATFKKATAAATDEGPEENLLWHPRFIGPRPNTIFPPLHHTNVEIEYSPSEEKILKMTPEIQFGTLLGESADSWNRDSSALSKHLLDEEKEIFNELIQQVAEATHPIERVFHYNIRNEWRPSIHISFRVIQKATPSRGPLLKLNLRIENETIAAGNQTAPQEKFGFEAILVDGSVIKFDSQEKLEKLKILIQDTAPDFFKNTFGRKPPIFIIKAQDSFNSRGAAETGVAGILFNFTDRRYFRQIFFAISRPEFWSRQNVNLHAKKRHVDFHLLQAAITRPALYEGLSEASLVLVDKTPLKPGTRLTMYAQFDSEGLPYTKVIVQVRSNKKNGENGYLNELIFFGISDEVQASIRRLIAANYAKSKSAE